MTMYNMQLPCSDCHFVTIIITGIELWPTMQQAVQQVSCVDETGNRLAAC